MPESYPSKAYLYVAWRRESFVDAFTLSITCPGCLSICRRPDHTVSDLSDVDPKTKVEKSARMSQIQPVRADVLVVT